MSRSHAQPRSLPVHRFLPGQEPGEELREAARRGEVLIVRWANWPNYELVGRAVASFLDATCKTARSH
jgi:hypothetical protein